MKHLLFILAAGLAVFTSASFAADARQKADKPERIAFGEQVDIKDYLVPGKTVIFDFTSKFCPPCEAIAPRLHKLHADRDDVVVVEVDINRAGVKGIDWKSPVAAQYALRSIPHFKVYDAEGDLQAEGNEARAVVNKLLQ